jgi:hypothetical protein
MRLSSRIAASLVLASLSAWSAPAEKLAYVHKKKFVMGTVFEIVAYDASPARASAAIDDAFQEILRLDGIMSNYKPESNLSRLNRSAHFHREQVPSDLYIVIEESLRYSRLSEGKFGGSFGELLESRYAWGTSPFFRGGRKTSKLCWLREDRAGSPRWCGAPLPLLANRSRSYWQRLRSGSCGSGSARARYF